MTRLPTRSPPAERTLEPRAVSRAPQPSTLMTSRTSPSTPLSDPALRSLSSSVRQIGREFSEQRPVLDSGARAFIVTNANLTGAQVAELFVENRHGSSNAPRSWALRSMASTGPA
jgi:hypothetical protein